MIGEQKDLPTLPKTGPLFARSFESHTANPSPKILCAFPSTCSSVVYRICLGDADVSVS
jgi:hypothetical protein